MFNRYLNNKITLIEGLIISTPLVWFLMAKMIGQEVFIELMINLSFLTLFATMFIFRSSNLRHMYFVFMMLILSIVINIFGFSNMMLLTSGLTLNLLILGTLNMIIFKYES